MSDSEDLTPPWLPAAEAALQAAIDGDLTKAGDAIEAALDEHGPVILAGFAMAWIDALRRRIGVPVGANVRTRHLCADDGQETTTPPDDVAWAGRLITARIGRDRTAFMALLEEANADESWGHKIAELVLVVAQTINMSTHRPMAYPRGAAFGIHPPAAHNHGLGDVRPPV